MTVSELIYQVKDLYFYCEFCVFRPELKIGCRLFWIWFYSIAAFLDAILFYKLARRYWLDRKQWNAYLNRVAEREKIAEPEVMEKYIWRGD